MTDPVAQYAAVLESTSDRLAAATAAADANKGDEAERLYRQILTDVSGAGLSEKDPAAGLEWSKLQENAIYGLAQLFVKQKDTEKLQSLFTDIITLLQSLPKVRTAKIVRTLVDSMAKIPDSAARQVALCSNCIAWARQEQRTFLRHRVETRLCYLYLSQGRYKEGIDQVDILLKEVKKLDDKLLLVEIHIVESRLMFEIKNIAKSKAALTAARTSANAIHCPPLLQSEIDLHAGVLHGQEADHKTGYSYFFEAFEALNAAEDAKAVTAFKYMCLAKIMCGQSDEVMTLTSGPNGVKYTCDDLIALREVAVCHKNRSLKDFEQTLNKYQKELKGDPIVKLHITALNEELLEQNIARILEPFARVEISHVARLIDLPVERVEQKLGSMILDKKLAATLDQGVGELILFDDSPTPAM
eukprot:Selendium_serpulae@DN4769_c0_g2_i1.p1